jgi:hypothetical protein
MAFSRKASGWPGDGKRSMASSRGCARVQRDGGNGGFALHAAFRREDETLRRYAGEESRHSRLTPG